MKKINIAFIQARMESKRFPGKNLKEICNYPMLDWVIFGVSRSRILDGFGLVIPETKESSIIKEKYLSKCYVYTGHHYNVLDRYYNALLNYEKKFNCRIDNVVRITADCPLLAYHSSIIDEVLTYHNFNNCDFTHNRCVDGYPSGIDVEVMTREILIQSWENVNLTKCKYSDKKINEYKEHVTLYAKENLINKLVFGNVTAGLGGFKLKWSIDDIESFERVEDLMKFLIFRFGNKIELEKANERRLINERI